LPELICGFPKQRSRGPTFYPVACNPQAWAAAAPISLIQSCLGMSFDPKSRCVIFNRPALPEFLNEITLKHLSIGADRVDVSLRRSRQEVVIDVLDRKGQVEVLSRL
jgi:glycogen debranching enzyme